MKMNRREFMGKGCKVVMSLSVLPAVASLASPLLAKNGAGTSVKDAGPGSYFETNFGIGHDTVRAMLSKGLGRGGDFSEVYFQHKAGDAMTFEDGFVNKTSVNVDLGVGVRVLKGDRTGYAHTEDLSEKSLLKAAQTAAIIADSGGLSPLREFYSVKLPDMYERKRVWFEVSPVEKISLAGRIGEKIARGDSRVIKSIVRFSSEDDVILVANSEGLFVEDRRPMTSCTAICVVKRKSRVESDYFFTGHRQGMDFYTEEMEDRIAAEVVSRAVLLLDASPPPAGEMPVVLAPGTSGILLHEAMGHGFEADFNRKKTSAFSSSMGKRVAQEFVTIVDSGLEPLAAGSINMDDEGVVARRTVLVDHGVLTSYLHDRISAKHFKVDPTGNGRRQDFRFAPMPRMRVTFMENGPHDPEEIIRSVKKGIYAVDFTNGQVNIVAGDFSFYVKNGFLIENGRLTRPIKDANLTGNGPDSLSKITMAGNDARISDTGPGACGKDGQTVPVGFGLPTVKVSSLTVGGAHS